MLLAPSYKFILIGYVPVYFTATAFLLALYLKFDWLETIRFVSSQPVYFFISIAFFAAFQNRELKRFFEQ